jgi:hypothetical protein
MAEWSWIKDALNRPGFGCANRFSCPAIWNRLSSLSRTVRWKQLTKAILERALQAELTDHLGFKKRDPAGRHTGSSRNGSARKVRKGDFGELELETPRDRQASFEPKIVAKGQTRLFSVAYCGGEQNGSEFQELAAQNIQNPSPSAHFTPVSVKQGRAPS